MNNDIDIQLLESIESIKEREITIKEKVFALYMLLNITTEEATLDETLSFKTLFARLSFIVTEYRISKKDTYLLHQFRIHNEKNLLTDENLKLVFDLGFVSLNNLIGKVWNNKHRIKKHASETLAYFNNQRPKPTAFIHLIEALVIKIDIVNKHLIFLDDRHPDTESIAEFDIPEINEPFTTNILSISKIYELPIHVNLVECEISKDGVVRPKAFVIQPDYLMDVTSIASNIKSQSSDIWLYGLNKFMSKPTSKYIIIGNIANFFLDALVANPNIELAQLYNQVFRLYPLEWALYNDEEIAEIISEIKLHFNNLKRVINEEFKTKDILIGQIYLEPSFYCRDYGIQGRLDLFHTNKDSDKADIIELKSGKPFMPNSYGINDNHYAQTLLYDMIITSSYSGKIAPQNYILYSKLDRFNLKYAPRIKNQQYEILKIRNELVAIDHSLALGDQMIKRVMDYLVVENYPGLKGFTLQDLNQFEAIYQTSTDLEKTYLNHYASFVGRESILSKTGEHGVSKSNGLAGLWLENMNEKEDRFSIINHLQLVKNNSDDVTPLLHFKKSEYTAKLSNFRIGDIAVLYPHHHNARNILKHQIFKCSIIEIDDQEVVVRMRSPQYNQSIFRETEFWNLEQDVLSSSFNHMYRNLFSFLASDQDKKRILLGLERPRSYDQAIDIDVDENLTSEQKSIVYKAFEAKDYFLIWGPPGTGKTSVVLKNIVQAIEKYTDQKILLLAYTNRAVDEICESLERAGLKDDFIRIGSRYSVGENFKENLLDEKIKDLSSRSGIVKILEKNRIFVSTVSSIIGKKELFNIINIDTVIIDEASQILEPMLIGLLTQFERFIMIGDHKQLPAVVTQNPKLTIIEDQHLVDAGFVDMRVSLFERLYMQCKDKGWDNAWSILTQQGRMHETIMAPVNEYFYEGKLKYIPTLKRLTASRSLLSSNDIEKDFVENRLIFINSSVDLDFNWKTNSYEAQVVGQIINVLSDIYGLNKTEMTQNSIGVITPYRAQIALIKSIITHQNLITVDTVERYQGGARDIIILSLCTNKLSQLASLVSLSTEGIDRKLNVALTRAKEQLIIIGNEEILRRNETYAKLIDRCHKLAL